MDRKMIWLGMFVGSFAGGYVPMLWGESAFSMSAVITSGAGAILGVWLAWRLTRY